MKTKTYAFVLLAAIVISLVVVSALSFSVANPVVLTKENNGSFKITNPAGEDIVITSIPATVPITDKRNKEVVLSLTPHGDVVVPMTGSKTIEVTVDSIETQFNLGKYSETITLTGVNQTDVTDNATKSVVLTFANTYCEYGVLGDLEISRVSDKSTGTEDDWEWKPLDEISIEVKVENNHPDNDIDVIVKLGLYDPNEGDFIELEEDDEPEEDININEDDSDTVTFNFVVPSDVEEGSYELYIKAYEDGEEETQCSDNIIQTSYQKTVKINKESNEVMIENIEYASTNPCGQDAEFKVKVVNIGNKDEDKVKVLLRNTELGINQESIGFSLDKGDSYTVTFYVPIPKDAEEKAYLMELTTFFDYKKSSDDYRKESDTEKYSLNVQGSCLSSETRDALITAELNPDTPKAVAGNQVIVDATVKNTGNVRTTYVISIAGNSAWSSLVEIDPRTITLDPNEQEEVNIYLNVDSNALGDESFKIIATYEGEVTEQQVELTIEEGISSGAVLQHLKDNWFIYVIILANVILIIAIIVAISRLSRRTA